MPDLDDTGGAPKPAAGTGDPGKPALEVPTKELTAMQVRIALETARSVARMTVLGIDALINALLVPEVAKTMGEAEHGATMQALAMARQRCQQIVGAQLDAIRADMGLVSAAPTDRNLLDDWRRKSDEAARLTPAELLGTKPYVIGVDVAPPDSDHTTLTIRQGETVRAIIHRDRLGVWRYPDGEVIPPGLIHEHLTQDEAERLVMRAELHPAPAKEIDPRIGAEIVVQTVGDASRWVFKADGVPVDFRLYEIEIVPERGIHITVLRKAPDRAGPPTPRTEADLLEKPSFMRVQAPAPRPPLVAVPPAPPEVRDAAVAGQGYGDDTVHDAGVPSDALAPSQEV